jgi:hypothetical protein
MASYAVRKNEHAYRESLLILKGPNKTCMSHFHKPIASVCHMTPLCEDELFLQEFFFDFMFHFVCNGWQNQAMCLHQVLCEAR